MALNGGHLLPCAGPCRDLPRASACLCRGLAGSATALSHLSLSTAASPTEGSTPAALVNTTASSRSNSEIHPSGSPCKRNAWPGRAVLPGELSRGKREQGTAFLGARLSGAGKCCGRNRAPAAARWPYKEKGRYFPSPEVGAAAEVRRGWALRRGWAHHWPGNPWPQPHSCWVQTPAPVSPTSKHFRSALLGSGEA